MGMHWRALLAAGFLLPSVALGADEPDAEKDLEVVPVDSLEQPVDDFVPLLPDFEWTLSGNVQGDALASSDLPSDREKSSELRRAHIGAVIDYKYDWRFKAAIDLAERAPVGERASPLRELSVEFRGLPVYIEAGRIVEPFGMLQGGSRNAALMERPMASGLAPGYGHGLAFNWRGDRFAVSGGFFSATENDALFGARKDDATTVRVSGAPILGETAVLHVGGAMSTRKPESGFLQFVTVPETVLLQGLNASSDLLFTERYNLYGLEVAGQWGPVHARSEYFQADIGTAYGVFGTPPGDFTFISPNYSGYYAEAAWAITGETRDYSLRRGMFSGIYPETPLLRGGFGALEVAMRYSAVDLTDENGAGEKGDVASLGVNWYPFEFLKLMVDGLSITEEDGAGVREDAQAIQVRLQAHYALP